MRTIWVKCGHKVVCGYIIKILTPLAHLATNQCSKTGGGGDFQGFPLFINPEKWMFIAATLYASCTGTSIRVS